VKKLEGNVTDLQGRLKKTDELIEEEVRLQQEEVDFTHAELKRKEQILEHMKKRKRNSVDATNEVKMAKTEEPK